MVLNLILTNIGSEMTDNNLVYNQKFNLQNHIGRRVEKLEKSKSSLLGLSEVELSLTELCNRTCSFCPRHDPKIYPNLNLNMSMRTVRTIKEHLEKYNFDGSVIFSGFGEPVLHKNIYEIISIFSEYNLEVITNGDAILSGKISIESLFENGLSKLILNNYDNDNRLVNMAKGDNRIYLRNNYDDGGDHYEEYGFNNRGGKLWKNAEISNNPCYVSAYRLVFDWNGDVLLCDHDWNKKVNFSNINKNDLYDIWYGEEFLKYRKSLYLGDRTISESCKNCNIMGNRIGEKYANLWIDSFETKE